MSSRFPSSVSGPLLLREWERLTQTGVEASRDNRPEQALAWLLERIQAGRSTEPVEAATQLLVPALVTRESSRAVARAAVPIVSGETL